MSTPQEDENIVSGMYDGYQEMQKEILAIEIRKTRNKLFTIAALIFIFDLIAVSAIGAADLRSLLIISVVPLIYVGLAFLSLKEPLLAMVIGAIIIIGLWIYVIAITGAVAAITGWLSKALIIYLLFAGFQNAREAHRIKQELKAH